jgi:nucleotide-binding universal stress UspA family protein
VYHSQNQWEEDPMAAKIILVPYNFNMYDERALDFVADTFRHAADARITLFHVYTPLPEIETGSNAVLGRLKDTMKTLRQQLRDQESILKEAVTRLSEKGIPKNHLNYVFRPKTKEVAEELVEMALGEKFDIIILSRKSGKVARFFGRSVSERLLSSLKGVAICVVS